MFVHGLLLLLSIMIHIAVQRRRRRRLSCLLSVSICSYTKLASESTGARGLCPHFNVLQSRVLQSIVIYSREQKLRPFAATFGCGTHCQRASLNHYCNFEVRTVQSLTVCLQPGAPDWLLASPVPILQQTMHPESLHCRPQYQLLISIFQKGSQWPYCLRELNVWGRPCCPLRQGLM